eukprot:TRINITY_DN4211_c0_g1_i1.p1 TRINITY_DN4211_c0_g1~~TRINITY_DN4211_c0_g1_i1.p1  ORF type:complete len:268 (+),score=53.47 TRINITY_DN4211_c0_g1_i1:71-805(+)
MQTMEPRGVVMKPPKITFISLDDYNRDYWPMMQKAVTIILANPRSVLFSQEEILRGIYNVCCQRHGAKLYNDLIQTVTQHLQQINQQLATSPDSEFIKYLNSSLDSYQCSIQVIAGLFRYLEKIYVMDKLVVPLVTILQDLFMGQGLCMQVARLKQILGPVPGKVLPEDPSVYMQLTRNLYSLDREFATLNPSLFAKFIPNLIRQKGDLEEQIQQTREFFKKYREDHPTVETTRPNAKRKYDES